MVSSGMGRFGLVDGGGEVAIDAVLHDDVKISSVYRRICRSIVQCGCDESP